MKHHTVKAIALVALMASSFGVKAIEKEECIMLSVIAEKTMEARQNGVPMRTLVDGLIKIDDELSVFTIELAKIAYKEDRYQTDRMKQIKVVEFGSMVLLECMKDAK